ncbi:hypothetical protein WJX73_002383 [Symbiochloris irregularis]|uniref:50S ribosomal protein L34, chloroplastic n=1 Tax=Symbiochloris irregularis TaxID=706552 RepID=A0AAW1NQH0_9CHLO
MTLQRSGEGAARRLTFTVQANGKNCLGCTKGGTRRKRTRTSGFRARMATKGGRKVLSARRKKGRKMIAGAHEYKKWSFLPGRNALPS